MPNIYVATCLHKRKLILLLSIYFPVLVRSILYSFSYYKMYIGTELSADKALPCVYIDFQPNIRLEKSFNRRHTTGIQGMPYKNTPLEYSMGYSSVLTNALGDYKQHHVSGITYRKSNLQHSDGGLIFFPFAIKPS